MTLRDTLHSTLSGAAGEFFAAAELSRRGWIVALPRAGAKHLDFLAEKNGRTIRVQVKTKQRSSDFVVQKHAEKQVAPDLFYVFVRLDALQAAPTFHVVPSSVVAPFARRFHRDHLGRGGKDSTMRKFRDPEREWVDRWNVLEG